VEEDKRMQKGIRFLKSWVYQNEIIVISLKALGIRIIFSALRIQIL
jgi:hypothetical protein